MLLKFLMFVFVNVIVDTREVVKAAGINELHINQWYSELNIQWCSGAVTKTEDSKHIYLGIVTEFHF